MRGTSCGPGADSGKRPAELVARPRVARPAAGIPVPRGLAGLAAAPSTVRFGVGQPAEELGIEELGPFLVRVVAGPSMTFHRYGPST